MSNIDVNTPATQMLRTLLENAVMYDAPSRTTYGYNMKCTVLPVGDDETATICLHQDAINLILCEAEDLNK